MDALQIDISLRGQTTYIIPEVQKKQGSRNEVAHSSHCKGKLEHAKVISCLRFRG